MFDDILRPYKEIIGEPFALMLKGVHPNFVTLFAFLLGLFGVYFAYTQQYALCLLFWLLNRTFDSLDGTMSRVNDQQSDFGGYLDIVLDFCMYVGFPLGIALGQPSQAGFIALAVLVGSFNINSASWMYLAAILEKRNLGAKANGEMTSVTMQRALIAGTETVLIFSAFIWFNQYFIQIFYAMAALVMVGVVQRLIWAWINLKDE